MLKTFRLGGVHPPESKLSATQNIEIFNTTGTVTIPLSQHIGAPAQAVVKRGDIVKVGTLIGKSSGFVSANIHSSVSGKVLKIDDVVDGSGYKKSSVVIKLDEEDIWEDSIDRSETLKKDCLLEPAEIIQKINEMGIVGMGGATFPTHVKLMPPKDFKADILIINAVECEPYLTSDHRVMLEHPDEVLIGTQLLMKAINVSRAVIGIENNKKDAIELLSDKAKDYQGIEIQSLKVKYPQGGEKQLIDAITKKMVKSGQLPISTGAVVQNVGTAFAVYEGVQKNKPLIERVVTITGKFLQKPSNLLVRIGTHITSLLEYLGELPEETSKIISGGPMMGKALANVDSPVMKGTSGVLLLNTKDTKRKPMRNCIRCAKCVSVCPMGLNPAFLMRDVGFELWPEAERGNVVDCIECGSCSFTCPANRPLLDQIRIGKQKVMTIIRSRKS